MRKFIALFLVLLLYSCGSAIINSEFKRMGFYENKVPINYLSNGTKEIAYLSMHHFGKQEFYNDVAIKIDSLKNEGFFFFYEGYAPENGTDSITADLNERKLRKLIGISTAEYFDPETNLYSKKYKLPEKYKLINQPSAHLLGIDTTKAIRADISTAKMITTFEKKYGEVQLSNCDLATSLESKVYNCELLPKTIREDFINEIVMTLRNKNLANLVHSQQSSKIAIVYGSLHLAGMTHELRKIDADWNYNN